MAQQPAKELGNPIPFTLKTCLMKTSAKTKKAEEANALTMGDSSNEMGIDTEVTVDAGE
jgi:hypothetical protein